ncbi:MAG: DedA family protein/thiosulfate sulfurtransferase GlpE [Pigmentiphaga sp.]|uniref:DedA family protein/thiosulfate sulfurtransferase GlpE n=1 Tax=Pigmentiphaga sp. TaxID=1977564 RepID=UPI0029A7A269|nr:DedA family protein/thiosulfate sulfurtransferase GlpE [Pigmentiphaga sp.]MDX3906654.1 DedA family protein/thiosulfate sulfurtransferase GlpE [Pigmentiphaga sp.]
MDDLQTLLVLYGAWLVFFNVLLEQAGLPIPAYPLLVVAGALAAQGELSWPLVLLGTTAACVLADSAWYLAGQRYGARLLSTVCRISLSPDSCIRQTQGRYSQVGPRLLLVAKFLPGAGALTTVMAGLTRAPYRVFAGYEIAGTLIWAGSAVLLGAVFHPLVADILQAIDEYGRMGLLFLGTLLGLYIAYRIFQRWRIVKYLRTVPRLSVDELIEWEQAGRKPVLLDVRPAPAQDPLPGALPVDLHARIADLELGPPDTPIVVYCACPNEISAALLAMRLRTAGYADTWALLGGHDAWRAYREAPDSALAAPLTEQP